MTSPSRTYPSRYDTLSLMNGFPSFTQIWLPGIKIRLPLQPLGGTFRYKVIRPLVSKMLVRAITTIFHDMMHNIVEDYVVVK